MCTHDDYIYVDILLSTTINNTYLRDKSKNDTAQVRV